MTCSVPESTIFATSFLGGSPQNFFWPSVTLNNFLPNVEAAYSASKNPWCGVNHYVHSRESFFAFFPTVVPPTSFVSHGLVNRDAESWCSLKKELESRTWWDRWPPEMQMMGIVQSSVVSPWAKTYRFALLCCIEYRSGYIEGFRLRVLYIL